MSLNMNMAEFVHRANVVKYQKILATYLTPHEREFVERRLAEERSALAELRHSEYGRKNLKLAC